MSSWFCITLEPSADASYGSSQLVAPGDEPVDPEFVESIAAGLAEALSDPLPEVRRLAVQAATIENFSLYRAHDLRIDAIDGYVSRLTDREQVVQTIAIGTPSSGLIGRILAETRKRECVGAISNYRDEIIAALEIARPDGDYRTRRHANELLDDFPDHEN